jgi:hypothetical protein
VPLTATLWSQHASRDRCRRRTPLWRFGWENVVVSVIEVVRRVGHGRRLLIIFGVGWLSLVACNYLTLPLFGLLPLGGLLVLAACWFAAVAGSVAAVVVLVRQRAYGWAAGGLVVALACGLGVEATNWERAYVDSQFRLQRGQLAELAASYRAGTLPPDAELPWRLRYLSVDGQAHQGDGVLYLPAWQDWRGESGVGLGYLPTAPGPDTMIGTALGDNGQPVRYLGDGWWWIA